MRTRTDDREAPAGRRRATWNGAVLADSADVITLEGNDYFLADALDMRYFRESRTHSLCPWKGVASYYDVVVHGVVNPQAAWYYPRPTPFARRIKGRVAFWNGVRVETVGAAEPERRLKGAG
jgi:uncharacterized protein (DUF427 family)